MIKKEIYKALRKKKTFAVFVSPKYFKILAWEKYATVITIIIIIIIITTIFKKN